MTGCLFSVNNAKIVHQTDGIFAFFLLLHQHYNEHLPAKSTKERTTYYILHLTTDSLSFFQPWQSELKPTPAPMPESLDCSSSRCPPSRPSSTFHPSSFLPTLLLPIVPAYSSVVVNNARDFTLAMHLNEELHFITTLFESLTMNATVCYRFYYLQGQGQGNEGKKVKAVLAMFPFVTCPSDGVNEFTWPWILDRQV
jgi:hypothetical protein